MLEAILKQQNEIAKKLLEQNPGQSLSDIVGQTISLSGLVCPMVANMQSFVPSSTAITYLLEYAAEYAATSDEVDRLFWKECVHNLIHKNIITEF